MNKVESKRTEPIFNLAGVLLNNSVVVVNGGICEGKTTFVKELLIHCFTEKKVAIIEPYKELSKKVENDIKSLLTLSYEEYSTDSIINQSIDLIVFEEAHNLENLTVVHNLREKGIKVLLTKHNLMREEILELGSHILISAKRSEPHNVSKVEEVILNDEELSTLPLYLARS